MMFKEYISATAEFLIIRQVSMAENAGIFPRENELPVCSSVLTLSSSPGTRESYRTPPGCPRAADGAGASRGQFLSRQGPAGARPRSGTGDDHPRVQLGLELEPRAELRLSIHVHPQISHSQPCRVTSRMTHWICCSYGHNLFGLARIYRAPFQSQVAFSCSASLLPH